jgi:DMSO/TMAO reductase YedYZ molybdopterin-dependent catalytic subunit
MSGFVSRGFTGTRRTPEEFADRLPPGQYAEEGFPVLTAGPTPHVPTSQWRLRIDGMVAEPREWTWEDFHELPFEEVPCDIHCVTKWSKLGTTFRGVSVHALFDAVWQRTPRSRSRAPLRTAGRATRAESTPR